MLHEFAVRALVSIPDSLRMVSTVTKLKVVLCINRGRRSILLGGCHLLLHDTIS